VPVAVAGLAFILFTSRWLLPDRRPFRAEVADARQYTTEMLVQPGTGLDGLTIEAAGLRRLPGTYLSAIERDGELIAPARPDHVLRANDRLVFVGVVDSVIELQRFRGLVPASDEAFEMTASRLNHLLVEVVVSNTSPVIGRTIRESAFRTRYDAAVIAVYRNGHRIAGKIGDIELAAGDALLLQAHATFAQRHRNNRDFLLVSKLEGTQPLRQHRAMASIAIMVGMVLVASLENVLGVSVFHAALVGAALMGLLGCLSAEQARRSIDVPVLLAIIGALTIGQAIQTTGLAVATAGVIVGFFQQFGTWAVLLGIYLLTLFFTELVTNNAAAALAFPIARATATAMGVDLMPFVVVVAIAASAGFATPLGYQTHLMVFAPGGYRFADFMRMGLPLDILCMIVAVVVTPLIFPF
jgi:di/tricarboxylate transporter